MTRSNRFTVAFPLAALLVVLAGCGGDDISGPGTGQVAAPDFHLADVNTASATHGVQISPRRYLGEISAYYFGHAT
jgi:hypothetical protein